MSQLDIIIPTLNEERRLSQCLDSIFAQDIPHGTRLTVTVVDAGSTDDTLAIAAAAGVPVLDNSLLKDPEAAKMIGLRSAKGDFLLFMDADMSCATPGTLYRLLDRLLSDDTLAGAFGRYEPRVGDVAINRALSMNPMQCDPFYQAFVPDLPLDSGLLKFDKRGVCVPPIAGTCMFRTKYIRASAPYVDRYFDVDTPVHLAVAGFNKFYYERGATFYHGHISTISELVGKRLRNLDNGRGNGLFTEQRVPRVFRWIAIERFGFLTTVLRAIAALTGFPLVPRAILKMKRYNDTAALLEPCLGVVVGWTVLWGTVRSKRGWSWALASIFRAGKSDVE